MWQGYFFFHYYLATSTTDWAQIFTGLLIYVFLCWDTPSEKTGLWQLPKVSTVLKELDTFGCCPRRVLLLGVSQHIHKFTHVKLWTQFFIEVKGIMTKPHTFLQCFQMHEKKSFKGTRCLGSVELGLWKAFETVCYKMHMVRKIF